MIGASSDKGGAPFSEASAPTNAVNLNVAAASSYVAVNGATMNVIVGSGTVIQGPGTVEMVAAFREAFPQFAVTPAAMPHVVEAPSSFDPLEAHLDTKIDRLRDAATTGDPREHIRHFQMELDNLPDGVSGTIRFRLKANIGILHSNLGEMEEAARWISEACDEAPEDHRAIANRALGIWFGGDVLGAYAYACEAIVKHPDNSALASYLPQIAAAVPDVGNPMEHVPEAFRDTEPLAVAETIFLRQKDRRPEWWERARSASAKHPDSKYLPVLCAFADVDEITRQTSVQENTTVAPAQRERILASATVLDDYWRSKPFALHSDFDDVQNALGTAMIAFYLARDIGKALELANGIADEGLRQPQIVAQAIQISMDLEEMELADRLVALLPDIPEFAFQAGTVAAQRGDLARARRHFEAADIPESERGLIDTFFQIGRIRSGESNAEELPGAMQTAWGQPRSLTLLSREAIRHGDERSAMKAFARAKQLIGADSHISARSMVASLASEIGTPGDVIDILDGYLDPVLNPREFVWLARAHATEHPHRQRNVDFFASLPSEGPCDDEVTRAHASFLADTGELAAARRKFKRLLEKHPRDSYLVLRLLEVLRREGNTRGADLLLRGVNVRTDGHYPENDMALCAEIAAGGESIRAYRAAYEIVRRHPQRAEIAMGYVGLDLSKKAGREAFQMKVAGEGACVTVKSPEGDSRTFVIDQGPEFFGIAIEEPGSAIARLVDGKIKGETVLLPKFVGDDETWEVTEVTSKYLHLHRTVLGQFETRFPGTPGIARFTVGDGDLAKVHEIVRKRSEAINRIAFLHVRDGVPLHILAAASGGDVVSLAGHIRLLGEDVSTADGQVPNLHRARSAAVRLEGKGVAMDTYTAFVAAEMDVLNVLRDHFGAIHVAQSAMDFADRLVEREREALGTEQMTLGYHKGGLFKEVTTDNERLQRLTHLESVKERMAEACTVHAAILPDLLSKEATLMLDLGGRTFLDPAAVALSMDVPLLSDDRHFREWMRAAGLTKKTLWMQPSLEAAFLGGHVQVEPFVRAMASLAARRHSHPIFSAQLLKEVCRLDDADLWMFRAMLRYLANTTAYMQAHLGLIEDFLGIIWSFQTDFDYLRRQVITGAVLDALVRRDDHAVWIRQLLARCLEGGALDKYVRGWITGHFIPGVLTDPTKRPNVLKNGVSGR